MKKFIYIFLFVIIVLAFKIKINANSVIDLCVVYEKNSYEKGDMATLSFDLPKFSNLFEVIIRVEYDQKIFSPIINNNEYFKLNNHSIFDKFVVNKKINENTIYAELMKNDVSEGYYSSYQNNLCIIDFNILSYVDNIEEHFSGSNIQIFLFDVNHNLINYEIKLVKMLEAGFYNTSYEINVYNDELLLENIFYVNNRKADEFLIFEEKMVDYSKLGPQILQIGVFDIITGKYLSYSTIVNIVDNLVPSIVGEDVYDILDTCINDLNFTEFIKVSDNFDKNVNVLVNYYNKEHLKLENGYIESLKKDLVIYIGFIAVDSSMNKSEEKIVRFNLIDTTSPILDVSDINIIDKDLESFEITNYISIYDELDSNSKVIMTFYNSDFEIIDNYKEHLTINNACYVDLYGVDKFNNISEKKRIKISLIDTTSPNIIYDEINYIDDVLLDDFNFKSLINIYDDDKRECSIDYSFYIGDELISEFDKFKELLFNGNECLIKFYVYDYSLNYNTITLKVIIKDTISPIINVNLEENKVYKELNKIEYEIIDNLCGELEVTVLLDDEIYNNQIIKDGKHFFYISAIDLFGNKSEYSCYFSVSSKSFVGNLIDGNVKLKSSLIVGLVLISITVIGILKFRNSHILKKNSKES